MLVISLPKLGRKLHYLHTKPNIIWLVGKTQRKPKFQKSHYNVANSKSHYDVANSKSHNDVANSMSHYDVANSKPATMRNYLQSPLLHGISKARYDPASLNARYDLAPLKAHCYTAILYKISKSFSQSPNNKLATILQNPNTNLTLISQNPNTNLAQFYKSPNNNLTTISLKPK